MYIDFFFSLSLSSAIGNAFSVLSDPEKRKKYDLYGEDVSHQIRTNRDGYDHYDYSRGFEGKI